MKNKTTYEMDDIMGLITRDLEEKGLTPDLATVEIWARLAGGNETRVSVKEVEIEANVSWVEVPERAVASPSPRGRREPDTEMEPDPQDLLDEAPRPGAGPVLEIGIDEVTAASTRISRSGGAGPFSPDRVKRRLTDGESADYPNTTPRVR